MSPADHILPSEPVRPAGFWRRPWSLAGRLTAWYLLSSFGLLAATCTYLYLSLAENMLVEDDEALLKKATIVRELVAQPDRRDALRQEIGNDWDTHRELFVRVRAPNGEALLVTPGMMPGLPSERFPAPCKLTRASITDIRAIDGRAFRVVAVRGHAPAPGGTTDDRVIEVAIDRTTDDVVLAQYRDRLALALIAALAVCAAASFQFARAGLKPVRDISGTARQIGSSTFGARIAVAGLPAELEDLATTFNGMLDRLQASFDRVVEFSDDIAHELKTPISKIMGTVEVVLSKDRSPEALRTALESTFEEAAQLSGIVGNLLFLARAERAQFPSDGTPIDVRREVEVVREFYEAAATEARIVLTTRVEPDLQLLVERTLFQRALGNLIDNAIKHTPAGWVEIMAARDGAGVVLRIADNGVGIAPEHLPRVFERFYRADRSRGTVSGNVGLGLAIVKSIVERYNGTVELVSRPGQGTTVTLRFPGPRTDPAARLP